MISSRTTTRPHGDGARPWEWDVAQRQVLAAAGTGQTIVVTGPPGSGKSTLAAEIAVQALGDAYGDRRVMVLTSSRRSAGRMREAVMARTDRTVKGVAVRSVASLAFAVLAAQARLLGEPDPVLITGPEQDVELAQLISGHLRGLGVPIHWPAEISADTLALAGFRAELRDVIMRCAERGLTPSDLAALAREHDRPAWAGVAAMYDEYLNVTDLASQSPDRGARFDSATIVDRASRVARSWAQDEIPARERWDLVVVDEYQDATAATARLLSALQSDGAQLILFADPDQTVQGFRGSRPDLVAAAELPRGTGPTSGGAGSIGAFGAQPIVLTRQYRFGADIAAVVAEVSAQIGAAAGVRHRLRPPGTVESTPAEPGPPNSTTCAQPPPQGASPPVATPRAAGFSPLSDAVAAISPSAGADSAAAGTSPAGAAARLHFRSRGDEVAWIAWRLRARHFVGGEPWSDFAVIVRSGTAVREIVADLQRSGVPARAEGAEGALKDDPMVRLLLETVLRGESGQWDDAYLTDLLGSPFGDLDPVAIRSLRRVLLADAGELGRRLLVQQFTSRGGLDALADSYLAGTPVAAAAYRVAAMITAAISAARVPGASAGFESAGVSDTLWRVWDAAGVAERIRDLAVQSGPRAVAADQSLDAMMTLFKQAEIYSERNAAATAAQFIRFIRQFDLPADSLAATSHGEAVDVLTPAQAAGRQWSHVIVAGVQVGTWPDLRLRDSLLGAVQLADIVDGRGDGRDPRAARRSVLDDELRLFEVACSRARFSLTITAVADDEIQPSPLCDLVCPEPDETMSAPPPLDLRGIVLRARHFGAITGPPEREAWATLLADLAKRGVAAADPATWYGVAAPTNPRALADRSSVAVSPSRVALAHQCSLRWAAETLDATPGSNVSNHVGSLVHGIARDLPEGDESAVVAALEERFGELNLRPGWPTMQIASEASEMARKLGEFQRLHGPPLARELEFSVDAGEVTVRGSIDRLDLAGAGLLVTDYKTGKAAMTAAEAEVDPQLATYQVALATGAVAEHANADTERPGQSDPDAIPVLPPAGARLVYLGTATKSASERSQRALAEFPDPQWAHRMVDQAADIMAAGRLWARIGDACRTCPIASSCPLQPQGETLVPPRGCSGTDTDAPRSDYSTVEDRRLQAKVGGDDA
ncbi:hypothetical protein GCM10010401_03030 [Rarobacter faecitabidus]|uniref:DNA 3'-5' helicase n=1 Tax=Rarobacter faecitabidus TaxID=13243 RepID=A0A542ZUS1_RARFA|nr:ATP-dependent DNA helicase [Rarobacter faecitabidus]TQL63940.1 UvrD-like helicase family protein [Rarobacter faecitabidus]